jgi:flagellar basal body-associated protein FliL
VTKALVSILGKAYGSADEAGKAKKSALLSLCILIGIQSIVGMFLWWVGISGNSVSSPVLAWPNWDGILLLAFAFLLHFFNSRILASFFVLLAVIELCFMWALKANATGDFSPPGMAVLLTIVAAQVFVMVFKSREWEKESGKTTPRSRWIVLALVLSTILTTAAFFVPPFHYLNYTRNDISLTEHADHVEYYDPLDDYAFVFPKTWRFDHLPFQYGDVLLFADEDPLVTVQVERWQPWDISPALLVNSDAFLQMAQDEAYTYAEENDVAVDIVEVLESPKEVNKARVILKGSGGSRRYIYYLYDKTWTRQSSDSAYFFWRLIAEIPGSSLEHEKEAVEILESFQVGVEVPLPDAL